MLHEMDNTPMPLPSLTEVLNKGGIYYRVEGHDQESVFKSLINILRLPEQIDTNLLLEILLARESLASTGIGDGIAIPHVRNPIIFNVPYSMMGLFFLEKPIEFHALDDKPVHILFLLISQTARHHLNLLSRLAFALRDSQLKQKILAAASRETLLNEFQRIDKELAASLKEK
jgi:PTS system nitrogen regulatory IIA component